MPFQMTSNIVDLGWPWRVNTHSATSIVRLSEPATKIWRKINAYYQRQKCSPRSLLSGGIRFMEIGYSRGLRSNWASNDSGWQKNAFFVISGAYNFGTFRAEAKVTIRRHEVVYRLSSERKMIDLEWPLQAILMLKSVFCVDFIGLYRLAFEQNYGKAVYL